VALTLASKTRLQGRVFVMLRDDPMEASELYFEEEAEA